MTKHLITRVDRNVFGWFAFLSEYGLPTDTYPTRAEALSAAVEIAERAYGEKDVKLIVLD